MTPGAERRPAMRVYLRRLCQAIPGLGGRLQELFLDFRDADLKPWPQTGWYTFWWGAICQSFWAGPI